MFKRCFAKAESWKIFAISVGCFIAGLLVNHYFSCNEYSTVSAIFIASLGVGSWIYFVGAFLYSKLPQSVQLSYRLFNVNTIFFPFCLLLIVLEMSPLNVAMGEIGIIDLLLYLFFIPLFFYFIYALIYIIYFISKALVSIEKNSEATFKKYISVFLLIVLFPIGIWFIQPRIRAIYFKTINAG